MFDFSGYRLRKLDINQGYKPLDFGGSDITGSVNKDGRLIAVNAYHPEHGYMTLTSIPPFPDEDRYDQQKVRAYRKSLVTNEGFGLAFEQAIVEREYYLIEDAIPFMRFTLADGTIAECVTVALHETTSQYWQCSQPVQATYTGHVQLIRAAYPQLTEGGILPFPDPTTKLHDCTDNYTILKNEALNSYATFSFVDTNFDKSGKFETSFQISDEYNVTIILDNEPRTFDTSYYEIPTIWERRIAFWVDANVRADNLVISRARTYAIQTMLNNGFFLTDHMILPLLWTRDSYYVVKYMTSFHKYAQTIWGKYISWLFNIAWRGTYIRSQRMTKSIYWGRSYLANGMQKDAKAFQFDQQLFPLLVLYEYLSQFPEARLSLLFYQEAAQHVRLSLSSETGLFPTDETPADDDIPMHYHFSSHILLWHVLHKYQQAIHVDESQWIHELEAAIAKYFITTHNGKQIYSYATDGEGNHYLYHDANDIPLVMMPLWGFCDKDDPIWLNTIEFAWSEDNIGCYKGCLGSVHSPNAAWSLGDAQELIYCKVVGDRERYQRVWGRIEKSAQWDGALSEAYNPDTGEVVSRHWFAWPNAMVAIADNLSWDWETEGEYAR